MSEAGRKDFSSKASESLTPDSSKSTTDKISETVTDTTDKAARGMQPDSNKSTTQEASDKVGRSKDENSGGVIDSTKNALGLGDK